MSFLWLNYDTDLGTIVRFSRVKEKMVLKTWWKYKIACATDDVNYGREGQTRKA
jgi:hypothetical protein